MTLEVIFREVIFRVTLLSKKDQVPLGLNIQGHSTSAFDP
jgi:hypothetical protein